jgi:hypothetical protein
MYHPAGMTRLRVAVRGTELVTVHEMQLLFGNVGV